MMDVNFSIIFPMPNRAMPLQIVKRFPELVQIALLEGKIAHVRVMVVITFKYANCLHYFF